MQEISDFKEYISALDEENLLSQELFEEIYDIEEPTERAHILIEVRRRAKELKCEKDANELIRTYQQADKKLTNEFNALNANMNKKIPLELDEKGAVRTTIKNFESILLNDPYFSGLRFNLLSNMPEITENGRLRQWNDADDAKTFGYIESNYNIYNTQRCYSALSNVFQKRKYHPIRQMIEKLVWDGTSRINSFLHYAVCCEDTAYTREVSRLIFAGGIHRIYNPGCKFDDVPVLIGTKQGEGKSTLVRWLAMNDDFFTEVFDIEGKNGMESLSGKWICELGELLALSKAKEVEAIKSFLSRQTDHYRRAFERRVQDYPRQCIFIGTTNKEQFLTDKTGNRRFYPVKVNQSGYELFNRETEIKEYIRQCWAEAKALYDRNALAPYADYTLTDTIRAIQSDAVEDDYRVGMIQEYLEDKDETCILELWQEALQMGEFSKPTKKDSNEISLILQGMPEWEKQAISKRFHRYGKQKYWKRTVRGEQIDFDDIFDI